MKGRNTHTPAELSCQSWITFHSVAVGWALLNFNDISLVSLIISEFLCAYYYSIKSILFAIHHFVIITYWFRGSVMRLESFSIISWRGWDGRQSNAGLPRRSNHQQWVVIFTPLNRHLNYSLISILWMELFSNFSLRVFHCCHLTNDFCEQSMVIMM